MKKLLKTALFTVATLVLCLLAIPTHAQAASESDLTFTLNEDGKSYYVYDCDTSASGELVIPVTYNGKPVTGIGADAFRWCKSLTNITIPDGVTSIGGSAFSGCTSLTSISIPDGVTSIEDSAFSGCTKLQSITLKEEVRFIGNSAFYNCTSLTSITIPNSVASIGNSVFYNCTSLTSITVPNSVISIGNSAFYNCTSLTSIIIPDSVTSIDYEAFYSCDSLSRVDIMDIAAWCRIQFVGVYSNPLYYANNLYLNGELVTDLIIPDGVIGIGPFAFYGYDNIMSVTISDSVISVGKLAFCECDGLKFVTIPDSVTDIGASAFGQCSKLNGIIVPASVTSIGDGAFAACVNLTSITIHYGVTSIGENAFGYCSSLTSITIPDSVTYIGSGALACCSNLEEITIPFVGESRKVYGDQYQYPFGYIFGTTSFTGGIKTTQEYKGYSGLTGDTYYIPSSLKSVTVTGGNILYGAFYNCNGLTNITISDTIGIIYSKAFVNCSSLIEFTIPKNVKTIEDYAFNGCSSLVSITMPSRITSIGYSAFYGCNSLSRVDVENIDKWWNVRFNTDNANPFSNGADLYSNGELITELIVPTSIEKVNYAFRGCTSLKSIIVPDHVVSIDSGVFAGCDSLTTITIPFVGDGRKTPQSTYQYPFGYIFGTSGKGGTSQTYYGSSTSKTTTTSYSIPSSLKSVTVTGGNILYGAFHNCSNLTDITIGDGINSISASAFYGCSSLENLTIPFIGESRKTAEDKYQYPLGYIFGQISFENSVETKQYYYGYSVSSITSSYFYIPASLKSVTVTGGEILYGAFYNCSNLTAITIPEKATNIGEYAFYNCTGLNQNIYNHCKYVGNKKNPYIALVGYTEDLIGSVDVHPDTKIITEFAFNNCEGLIRLTIPKGITTISDYAFYSCYNLTAVVLPETVTFIGDDAFSSCYGLSDLYITNLNAWWVLDPDTLRTYADCIHLMDTEGVEITELVLENTITEIPDYAFYNFANMTNITIPDGVTTIGNYAFYNCNSLTTTVLSNSVTTIGEYAYYNCRNLTNITIPDSVVEIGQDAFYDCDRLRSVVIGDGVKTIGNAAFAGCDNLSGISLGSGVQSIGEYAFSGCYKLESIVIPDGVSVIGNGVFSYCEGLKSIVIPSGLAAVLTNAFNGCNELEDVYYLGTKAQKNNIAIASYNSELVDAQWHCGVVKVVVDEKEDYYCAECDAYFFLTDSHQTASITFLNWNGDVLSTKNYYYGDVVSAPTNPTKPADNTYTYTFAGWDKTVVSCAGDATYTAIYIPTYIDYTVQFKDWNGNVLSTKTCHWGETVVVPTDPTRVPDSDGSYVFTGWDQEITACDGNKVYTATYMVGKIADVSASSWQFKAVVYVCNRGLMSGKGTDANDNIKFDPNSFITREEFVQVLYNAEGKPSVAFANKFPDVGESAWFKNAVLWANANNIANGMGNGNFGVGKSITRQDLALMLYKYAKMKNVTININDGEISKYADGSKVAGYAREAMNWAVTNGVLSGKGVKGEPLSKFNLDPAGTATRAECAAMLKNFMEAFGL